MRHLILDSKSCAGAHAPTVGGKARNLAILQQAGERVPRWLALSGEFFRDCLRQAGLRDSIAATLDSPPKTGTLAEFADDIRATVLGMTIPEAAAEAIWAAVVDLLPADAHLAVRSSASDEDAADASLAGLHDSFLFVQGRDALLAAVRGVWASAFNERALVVRLEKNLPLDRIQIGVVIQEMIEPVASGVAFTADPVSGTPTTCVVSALWGAGEGLVSRGFDADTFTVPKGAEEVRAQLANKPRRVVFDRAGGQGLVEEEVPPSIANSASLSDAQVREVAAAACRVERVFGRPQDIEFCVDADGALFLLQARPITTVEEYGPAAGNPLIWDNSNIVESYSGVTTPLTFSFIRHVYTVVYECFSNVMGIPRRSLERNRPVYANMLGLIEGRVYYNLVNWYRLIQQFPGYAANKRFMESMMGVREPLDPEGGAPPSPSPWRRMAVEYPRLLWLGGRIAANFLRLGGAVERFQDRFRRNHSRWEAMDFSRRQPHELMGIFHEMEERLLRHWHTPIVNDFYVMVYYGLLKHTCTRWCGDDEGTLQNDLICGEGDVESTEPLRMLMRMTAHVRSVPELEALFREQSPAELPALVDVHPNAESLRQQVEEYLRRYGARCINELKLEEPSLRETPEFLFQMIRNYLHIEDEAAIDPDALQRRERGIREQAEKRAAERLKGRPVRRLLFRRILRNARLGVRNRENMRFARTRIYGEVRRLFNAIGDHFATEGILDARQDIYHLTVDEVWDFIKGTAVTTDLRGLSALRRSEFDRYQRQEQEPADRFETWGVVYHRNRFHPSRAGAPSQAEGEAEGVLRGTGCCPGIVTGTVRIVRSPRDDLSLNGEILVAERTDPGWVPLYPAVSGVLIGRGSILSHSAIVAREMGIPTIVGIPALLDRLQDGQTVTMDGAKGTVEVSDAPPQA